MINTLFHPPKVYPPITREIKNAAAKQPITREAVLELAKCALAMRTMGLNPDRYGLDTLKIAEQLYQTAPKNLKVK